MATPMNNTGNAVGSTDPRDLMDNAQVLDGLINGDEEQVTGRTGKNLKSWAGFEREMKSSGAAMAFANAAQLLAFVPAFSNALAVDTAAGEYYYWNGSAWNKASYQPRSKLVQTTQEQLSVAKIAGLDTRSAIIDSSGKLAFATYTGWSSYRLYLTGREKYLKLRLASFFSSTSGNRIPFYIVVDKAGVILGALDPGTTSTLDMEIFDLPVNAHSIYLNYHIAGSDTLESYGNILINNRSISKLSPEQKFNDIIQFNGLNDKTSAQTLDVASLATNPNILIGKSGAYAQSAIYQGWRMARIDLAGVVRITGTGNSFMSGTTNIPALVVFSESGTVLQYAEASGAQGSVTGNNKIAIDLTLAAGASYALVMSAYLFDGGSITLNFSGRTVRPVREDVDALSTVTGENGIVSLSKFSKTLSGATDNASVLLGNTGVYATGATYNAWFCTRISLVKATTLRGVATSYSVGAVYIPALVIYNAAGAVIQYIEDKTTNIGTVSHNFDITVTPEMAYAIVQYRNLTAGLYVNVNYSENVLKGMGERVSQLEVAVGSSDIELIHPIKIYSVANDIDFKVAGQVYTGPRIALKRNFSSVLHLDNFIPYTDKEHPSMKFSGGDITKIIPPYSPVITAGAIENPNLNGGQNVFEESVTYAISGNQSDAQTHTLVNRSTLNSASKDKTPVVLIIGDSVSFGQDAYFSDSNAKWNYTMILNRMFAGDRLQNGGSGYDFRTVGTISYTDRDGKKSFNEAYSGTTMQGSGLFTNPRFLDSNGNFSFGNWLQKYRTCNAQGRRLYFNASQATTGTAGPNNVGYLDDGSNSGLLIGSQINNTMNNDIFEPTHVFCFHCSNGAISKADYDLFISRVRASFPNAIIGLGTPHVAGTYFPSRYPDVHRPAIWDYDQTYNNRQVATARVLLNNFWNASSEANNVFVLPTMWVTPGAHAFSCITVNEPYRDIIEGDDLLMPVGQRADVHVGSKAQAAYAYQLYAWLKWTAVKGLY